MNQYSLELHGGAVVAAAASPAFNVGTGDFSVEVWVQSRYPGTLVSRKGTQGGAGNGGFLVVARPDGTLKFATDNGVGFYEIGTVPTTVLDGTWHHVAAVRAGAGLTLYLDGQPVAATGRGNARPPLNTDNGLRLLIGDTDQAQEPYGPLPGMVTDVRLWNRARTAAEVAEQRSVRLTGSEPALVGYWPMDFGQALDFSPTRAATQALGGAAFTTEYPALASPYVHNMTLLFSGAYGASTRSGGTQGSWSPAGELLLSDTGTVVWGGRVVNAAVFAGNGVSWPAAGNAAAASIQFRLSGDSAGYWPEGAVDENVFEGWVQYPGKGQQEFRGRIGEQDSPCAIMQNAANGLVIEVPHAAAGAQMVMQPLTPDTHQHFCVTRGGLLVHMMSGLAMTAGGGAGSPVVLAARNGGAAQQWTLDKDGHIRSGLNPDLILSLTGLEAGAGVVLASLTADIRQRWFPLAGAQFVYNGTQGLVLDAAGAATDPTASAAGATRKDTGTAGQLWYFVGGYVVSALNGKVLAVLNGAGGAGARVGLQDMRPGREEQTWSVDGTGIASALDGSVLDLSGTAPGSATLLAPPPAATATQHWTVGVPRDASALAGGGMAKRGLEGSSTTIPYVVYIHTGNYWFAGTDDRVEVSLLGTQGTTALVRLSHSETHGNAFEAGNTDRFTVQLPDVGELMGVYVRYGANTWFGGEKWVVDWLGVYDPSRMMYYQRSSLGNGMQFSMPYSTTLKFNLVQRRGRDDRIAASMYPAEGYGGWIDHTWATIEDTEKGVTYFDAAGGHAGSPATPDIVVTHGSLNDAIRMATGYDLSPSHPWKQVYGHNDVSGVETCGITASGFRRWDGQCHQIVNRLLHVGLPRITLGEAASPPAAYGLSCLLWGPYGIGFDDWCRSLGFPPPPSNPDDAIFNYIRMFVTDTREAHRAYYYATEMQSQWVDTPDGEPDGPVVADFIKALHDDGVSNTTISNLTCLPEDKVAQDVAT
jgi:hypothetical protein